MRELDAFIERAGIELAPLDIEQARLARLAFSRYGKGRHRAGLNVGDGLTWALTTGRGESLLFKGDDCRHADITPAVERDR